jgi:16S rRNA A1518/A1519 N6-dimethyltransferase RsmA/KsgA/DIM1 with predicted DNA glycosylase/AP lyase activity
VHDDLRAAADPSLSQYFLVAPDKLAAVVDAAGIRPTDHVVELGAGAGTVALSLPACASLTLVELDGRFAGRLRRTVPHARIVEADALAVIRKLPCDVLIGNLPHAVTDELIALLPQLTFRTAVLSVRESARPGPGWGWTEVAVTSGEDFVPPQPIASKIVRIDGAVRGPV